MNGLCFRGCMLLLFFSSGFFFLPYNTGTREGVPQEKPNESQIKVNISGIWESNIGWKYDIKQKGSDFTWTVINRNQTATGTIAKNNKDIQATWKDNGSQGTSKGSILETDEKGKAIFIEWDNGVFFHRNK